MYQSHKIVKLTLTNTPSQKRGPPTLLPKPMGDFSSSRQKELNTAQHQNSINEARTTQFAANVTTLTPTFSRLELAMYHHQFLGNPRKETMLKALRKHPSQFQTFPGLSYELVSAHLPPSEATEKGHMIMTRKGLRSTRTMANKLMKARHDISNFLPAEEVCLAEEDEIYCYAILGDSNENTIYSDLTGRFPVESYDGKTTCLLLTCTNSMLSL